MASLGAVQAATSPVLKTRFGVNLAFVAAESVVRRDTA